MVFPDSPVLEGICAGKASYDVAEGLIVEISGLISFGQMFDSPQGPVLFLARILRQGTLRVKRARFSDHDVLNS